MRQKTLADMSVPFHTFDETPLDPMTPARALEYFRRLVPTLALDAETWTAGITSNAFTIAGVTELSILDRIKSVIGQRLETGEDTRGAIGEIDALLDEAGLTERNPVRAESIFRTEMMQSFNGGAEEEGLEVADTFPVYRYSNPNDGRSRPHHATRNGRYYRNAPGSQFSDVRGLEADDVIQCRCVPIFIDRYSWIDLQKAGARVEETW